MPVSAGGVIREVYRIVRWSQVDVTETDESPLRRQGVDAPSRTRLRWMFDGEVDAGLQEQYIGKYVPAARRSQVPTLWFESAPEVAGERPRIISLNRDNQ